MFSRKKFANGFEYVEIRNSVASAKIALQGAHIFEYKCKRKEDLLWLSEESTFEYAQAIRGGVPICWPRFGSIDASMPAHGFSRTAIFELVEVKELSASLTEVRLRLSDDAQTRKIWDFSFVLDVIFRISDSLEIEMLTTNKGKEAFMLTQALHSYLSVSDIPDVKIRGLEGKEFLDTLTDERREESSAITIDAECDRVYFGVDKDIVLEDAAKRVKLQAKGSASAVVWNPWIEKGSRMSGMKAEAYKEFVCIETANAFDDFRVLQAEESHRLSVRMEY